MGDSETTTPSFLMGSHVLPTGSWRAGANFEPWQVFFLQVAGFLMFTSKGGDGGVVFWHLERCQELWLPIAMPSKARNAAEKRNLFLSLWLVVNLWDQCVRKELEHGHARCLHFGQVLGFEVWYWGMWHLIPNKIIITGQVPEFKIILKFVMQLGHSGIV